MIRALQNLSIAILASACTAFSPAPAGPGCDAAIRQQYAEVTATAALNQAQARPTTNLPGGYALPPTVSMISVSDATFCRSRARSVLCSGNRSNTALTLAQITAIDLSLRAEFTYISDDVLHGRTDWWTNDRTCGDCEDYALILSERLSAAGQAGYSMGLVIWAPSPTTAHATLLVNTADAGAVEIGVNPSETPHPMDWTKGRRAAYMVMDGNRNWTLLAR